MPEEVHSAENAPESPFQLSVADQLMTRYLEEVAKSDLLGATVPSLRAILLESGSMSEDALRAALSGEANE